ncbi:MAG: hypothetical protein ACYTHN_13645, partial [Planctomycetota bacterium]
MFSLRNQGFGILLVLGFAVGVEAGEPLDWLETRATLRQFERLRPRLPAVAANVLATPILGWSALPWPEKQRIEKILLALDGMLPYQITEWFKEVKDLRGKEKRERIRVLFDRMAKSGEPALDLEPSAVVVVIGGDIHKSLAALEMAMPRIREAIRPFGMYVPDVRPTVPGHRNAWIAEFLTALPSRSLKQDGDVFRFHAPTFCDLLRKAGKVSARDCWIVARGDGGNILYDAPDGIPGRKEEEMPVALFSSKLARIDTYVKEVIAEWRGKDRSPLEIRRMLRQILTPNNLRLDNWFTEREVQFFLRDVIAEHGGAPLESEAFQVRLGVRLLQDPVQAPRLAVFRFSGAPEIRKCRDLVEKRKKEIARMRDLDEACYQLWRAFRSNPYYKRTGSFILVHEGSGALFAGTKFRIGTMARRISLRRFLPT